jgi:hypothetical protein
MGFLSARKLQRVEKVSFQENNMAKVYLTFMILEEVKKVRLEVGIDSFNLISLISRAI